MNLPKKSLGQNYLIDKNIINKITKQVVIKNKNILEIGPGTANLTDQIIQENPKHLILIEKDKYLFSDLKKKFNKKKNIQLFNDDFLKFDLVNNIKNHTVVFGNLPYNISSQILVKLIKNINNLNKFDYFILMFQKELADKIIAKFKSKNYGRLSILSSYSLDVLDKFNISKNCFYPKPKVESTLIVFKPKKKFKIKIHKLENIEKITNIFFSQKRKMINKAFRKIFINYKKYAKKLDLELSLRPSEISEEKYFKIVKEYEDLI